MRHPHADLIIAWAEDTSRVVQWICDGEVWVDCCGVPGWAPNVKYRFKPEPKPDVVRYVRVVDVYGSPLKRSDDNLKLTFDGEDGRLIKAEVIGE